MPSARAKKYINPAILLQDKMKEIVPEFEVQDSVYVL